MFLFLLLLLLLFLLLLLLIQKTYLSSFVKIGSGTAEILMTMSLQWWVLVEGGGDGGVKSFFCPNQLLSWVVVELGLWQKSFFMSSMSILDHQHCLKLTMPKERWSLWLRCIFFVLSSIKISLLRAQAFNLTVLFKKSIG